VYSPITKRSQVRQKTSRGSATTYCLVPNIKLWGKI